MSNAQTISPPADLRTYDEVCESICMLTCILNGVQIGLAQDRRAGHCLGRDDGIQEAGRASGQGTSIRKAMQHITTLLATESPRSPKTSDSAKESNHPANRTIAVTGRIKPNEKTMEILTTRDNRLNYSPRVMEFKKLTAQTDGEKILESWYERSVEDHFADVFTMLDCLRVNGPGRGGVNILRFATYIMNHAHFKTAGRMAEGEQLWKVHPIHALRRRIPSISIPDHLLPFELKGVPRSASRLIVSRGFLPSTINGHQVFIVDKDNLASWSSLVCDVHQELDDILLERELKVPEKTRAPRVNVGPKDIVAVVMNLQILHALLKAQLVDLFLEDDEFSTRLEVSYGLAAHDRRQKIITNISGRSVAPEPTIDIEEAPVKVATESLRLPGEKHNKYVVRYLKTIVAWIEAFSWATSSRNLSVTLRPYELVLPSPPFRIEEHDRVPQFIRRLLGQLDNRITEDELELVLGPDRAKLKASSIRSAPVHAEAVLMGVACASWNTETAQDSPPDLPIEDEDTRCSLRDIFPVQEVTISVSNLCCWCCWKLRALLSELNSDDAAACPQFLLSGTHATILPWYPPPCGIRSNILETVETELILEVEKLVRRRAYDPASHQSSTSSADSRSDDVELDIYLDAWQDEERITDLRQEKT